MAQSCAKISLKFDKLRKDKKKNTYLLSIKDKINLFEVQGL